MVLTLSLNSNFEPCCQSRVVANKRLNIKALTVKTGILAGAACAVLTVLSAPATAATTPEVPIRAPAGSVAPAVDAFYASRGGAPLWLRSGSNSLAANELIGILQRAPLDGLASGPALALQAQLLAARASIG